MDGTYVGNASHTNTLEFATIKLFDCGLEIRSRFELNKASVFLAKQFEDIRD